jgi:hypothetical protein
MSDDPWGGLDAAAQPQTGKPTLHLDPTVMPAINNAFGSYSASLQQLINDHLNDARGYFGTNANPLAVLLENAFNSRGTTLTNYLIQQLCQTTEFVNTAQDAAAVFPAADNA